MNIPDGMTVVFKKHCRYGAPGEIKTMSRTTAHQLVLRQFCDEFNGALPSAPLPTLPAGPKSFTIISNITNGAGLEKDYLLVKSMLESYGHSVRGEMFNDPTPTFRACDVNIFLEVINPHHLRHAKQNWIVPNSEWWYDCWNNSLPYIHKVLCKTVDCYELWCRKVGDAKCVYIGFEANDFYREDIVRVPTFLHLAGKSETKNTAAVMDAWKIHKLPYPLIVSAFKPEIVRLTEGVPNVTQVTRFPDVVQVMNECRFHIMPSKNEGFGHALSEAAGCKGVIITTDAPPMNRKPVDSQLLIPVLRTVPRLMTKFYEVSPTAIADRVHAAAKMSNEQLTSIGEMARTQFLAERDAFRVKFAEVVSESV